MDRENRPEADVDVSEIWKDKGDLLIGALNTFSLTSDDKKNSLKKLLTGTKFNVLVLVESKLNRDTPNRSLKKNGYSFYRSDRRYAKKGGSEEARDNRNNGGGLLIYIRNSVVYKVRSVCEYAENNVQFVHIEITNIKSPLHLVAVYSPLTSHFKHVVSVMSQFLTAIPKGVDIVFIGDFNINLIGHANSLEKFLKSRDFVCPDVLQDDKIRQLIQRATHGESCIDHIYTSSPSTVQQSGTFSHDIPTDHNGVYCTLHYPYTRLPEESAVSESSERAGTEVAEALDLANSFCKIIQPNPQKCILAVFYKTKLRKSEESDKKLTLQRFESVTWTILDQSEISDGELKDYVKKEIASVKGEIPALETLVGTPQCTIFARDHSTEVFQALQKRMWFQDWDVIWQPRHVVFCGVELEPTLTHHLASAANLAINKNLVEGLAAVRLQSSLCRYFTCEVKQCTPKEFFKTKEALAKHQYENHCWCAMCDNIFSSNEGSRIRRKFIDGGFFIPYCKPCFDGSEIRLDWSKYKTTVPFCGDCGTPIECKKQEHANVKYCYDVRYVRICGECDRRITDIDQINLSPIYYIDMWE